MATIADRRIIETLLENDGMYPGDPQADSIFEYTHRITGASRWAVYYAPKDVDIHLSPFVGNYIRLWDRRCGHLAPIGILEQLRRQERNREENL